MRLADVILEFQKSFGDLAVNSSTKGRNLHKCIKEEIYGNFKKSAFFAGDGGGGVTRIWQPGHCNSQKLALTEEIEDLYRILLKGLLNFE